MSSDCGCDSNGSGDGTVDCDDFGASLPSVSGATTGQCSIDRYAVLPVRTSGVSSTSSDATTSGSTSTSSTSSCPANGSFYSLTLDQEVTLPAVGGFFQITVCDASKWRVGMWLKHPLGKFPITSVNTSQNFLTLRNSCDDNTAIPGNGVPGDSYGGSAPIWPVNNVCEDQEETNDSVTQVLELTTDLCFPNLPEQSGSEITQAWGVLASCVNTCTGEVQEGTRCVRIPPQVFYDLESIRLPAATEGEMGERTFNGLNSSTQLLMWDPMNGKVTRVQTPGDGDYVLHVDSGIQTFEPLPPNNLFYESPKTIASASGNQSNYDLNTLTGVTVPSWATHAIIEARARVVSISGLRVYSGQTYYAKVSVNNREVAKASDYNQGAGGTVYYPETTDSDTNIVYARLGSGNSIQWEIDNFADGNNYYFESHIKLLGFTRAVTA